MVPDPIVHLPDRVVGQVGLVAFRRCDLAMTEELPDRLERLPEAVAGLPSQPRTRPSTLYYSPIWLLEICSRQPDSTSSSHKLLPINGLPGLKAVLLLHSPGTTARYSTSLSFTLDYSKSLTIKHLPS